MDLDAFDLDDLKVVYTSLQGQLLEVEELVDSRFLSELQDHLRARATDADVDTRDHGEWARWLAARSTPGTRSHLRLLMD